MSNDERDDELDAMTRWVVEHLGPDVPMHFTAFHPDYRMLDRDVWSSDRLSETGVFLVITVAGLMLAKRSREAIHWKRSRVS